MKNLKEIKLMMERLESPRLTETELNYKKSLLKEEVDEKDDSDNNEYSIGDKVTVAPSAKTGERIVVSKIGVDPKNTDYPTPGMEGTVSTFDKLKDRVYVVFSSKHKLGKDEYAFQPNELKKERQTS
jgi:hypothetical protein